LFITPLLCFSLPKKKKATSCARDYKKEDATGAALPMAFYYLLS
jgi:hypothetical protein